MKNIKNKIYISVFSALVPVSLITETVSAQCKNGQIPSPFDPQCTATKAVSVGDIISRILPVIPVLIGIVLFGVLLWGGFQVFVSGPNDDQKKKGFQTIQNAITGVVLLVFSVGIVTLLETLLGVKLLFGIFVS